jgi:hypothetical protein
LTRGTIESKLRQYVARIDPHLASTFASFPRLTNKELKQAALSFDVAANTWNDFFTGDDFAESLSGIQDYSQLY